MIDIFENRRAVGDKTQIPVWFMRQAGRYHSHYQNLKKTNDFMSLCVTPDLAEEVTLGPIRDFKFDAAILFSDLLFPLDYLRMGLSYESGPPTLAVHLDSLEAVKKLQPKGRASDFFNFQKEALKKLTLSLPEDVTLLGFVGAPFTLYTYAVEGSHSGNLHEAKKGLFDGRYNAFLEKILPTLLENLVVQAQGGAKAICLFDTALGELCLQDVERFIVAPLHDLISKFKKLHPEVKIFFYSKTTNISYLKMVDHELISGFGIDWRVDLVQALETFGDKKYIQGNIDPSWLHLPWADLEKNLEIFWGNLKKRKLPLHHFIFNLGHGITVGTPQDNVKKTVEYAHRHFHT